MRAWIFAFMAVFGCGGSDVNIGSNDSGNTQDSSSMMDAYNGADTGNGPDATNDAAEDTQNNDSGSDSGWGNDANMCMPKLFSYQCVSKSCMGGETEYCLNVYPGTCPMTPKACACNYTCNCLLANISNPCGQGKPFCATNGQALYINCN